MSKKKKQYWLGKHSEAIPKVRGVLKICEILRGVTENSRLCSQRCEPACHSRVKSYSDFFPHEIGKKITTDLPGKIIFDSQLGIYS